ncbi:MULTISPECIES: TetR/AcrR family transcriptional regulator [unclassified Rhizobium]|uniref:TetR/AcrR family transcriptional regulator n=1 Tax=unclassified Rhizobium TaxID=2613769 RepID=UPI001ADC1A97|nr:MULTISPECIES: TetR/AcrR family transcriptional regulator [unclassified Rhizobium]MBO9123770.1 TetR/AcrR family transcriptional regulator [Rhizobium sp. 16-488-2b]MBO9174302.1 TetR/AcrR family transcriptional regulator [Rhizobium sp. 16-488-2a]
MPREKSSKSYLSAEEREQQIVSKAIEFFSDYGFQASTREIAKHIGITQPLLYRYFKTKNDLIDRVYKEIFLTRWKGEWQTELQNRDAPFRDRLKRYLRNYCDSILDRNWIRIFLLGALNDQTINRRYLAMLQERTFPIILNELYASIGIDSADEHNRSLDNEILWSFHSSFFYIGVRKYVYQLDVPENLDEIVDARVDAFLDGAESEFISRRKKIRRAAAG